MKTSRLEKVYVAVLVLIFAGIVFQGLISVEASVFFPKFDFLIKAWKEVFMLLLVPLAVVVITKHKLWRELKSDWVIWIISLYALLHLVTALFSTGGTSSIAAGLVIDLRYILFFGLVYVAVKALPTCRSILLKVAVVGAFVVVGFATLQLFLPPDVLSHIGYSKNTIAPYLTVDKNPQFIRVNSTLRGPNPLGAYAGMVLALLTAALVRGKIRIKENKVYIPAITLAVCSFVALWISYSRSALLAAVIEVVIVIGLTLVRKIPRRTWVISSIVLLAVVASLVVGRESYFVSNVILHENPNGGSAVSSNEGHVSSLEEAVSETSHRPFGDGIGSTGSASLLSDKPVVVEDQYLFVAHEVGWMGIILFLALYVLLLIKLYKRRTDWLSLGLLASGVGLGIIGLLLPVWVDDTVSIVWWGLVAIALGGNYDRKQTKQKTS